MDYSTRVLGSYVVAKIREKADGALVTIGRDRFVRGDFAAERCFSFIAAMRLSAALARFKVKDTRDLFTHVEPEQLAIPGIGAHAFAVLGVCFAVKGLGTIEQWVERSRAKNEDVVTWHTMKAHAAKGTTRATTNERKPRAANGRAARAQAADGRSAASE